jgi:hypothetical protein
MPYASRVPHVTEKGYRTYAHIPGFCEKSGVWLGDIRTETGFLTAPP